MTSTSKGTIALGITLNVLNVLDGASTLHMIAHGATELNPITGALLSLGAVWWLGVKIGVVAICSLTLALLGRRWLLGLATGLYAALVVAEFGSMAGH